MTGEALAIELVGLALRAAPAIVEILTGSDRQTLDDRIERARVAVLDPLDPSDDDDARRAELERIVRGAAAVAVVSVPVLPVSEAGNRLVDGLLRGDG